MRFLVVRRGATALNWQPGSIEIPLERDVATSVNIGDYVTGEQSIALLSGSIPGMTYTPATGLLAGTPTTEGSYDLNFRASDVASSAAADWAARIAGAGVVWYHSFDSDNEVNAFRWTPTYGSGNDPLALGPRASWCRRVPDDGVDGTGCLEIIRQAGSSEGGQWWRPFSPIVGGTTTGNGRGVGQNDPGANGTLPAQAYTATNGGSQISAWQNQSRPGWYGHSSYHSGTQFDGTEFFVQMRIKMDPRRTTPGNSQVGKLIFLTTTSDSLTAQEIVTYSGAFPVAGVGQPNYHAMYTSGSPPLEDQDSLSRPGQQIGSEIANYGSGIYCDRGSPSLRQYCWAWSGGWDTVMYHITPGRAGVEETRIVVYAAHQGETVYTKIWDIIYDTGFEQGNHNGPFRNGWNGLLLATFNNGLSNSEFYHRYDQIIFSKAFIPCPQV